MVMNLLARSTSSANAYVAQGFRGCCDLVVENAFARLMVSVLVLLRLCLGGSLSTYGFRFNTMVGMA